MEICPLCYAEKDLRRVQGLLKEIRICRGCGFQVARIINFMKVQNPEGEPEVAEGESEGDLQDDVEAFNIALKKKTTTRSGKKATEG